MIKIGQQLDTRKIQQDLKALSEELKEKAVRAGIARVANQGAQIMRELAPVDSGNLQKSIRRKQLSDSAKARLGFKESQQLAVVGPNMKIAGRYRGRVANILEDGAKKHLIVPRKESKVRQMLVEHGLRDSKTTVLSDHGGLFAKKIEHPGFTARRFIKRSDEALQGSAVNLFYSGVQAYLKRKKLLS